MRIIIYTGKGGVGKTSVAAATAVRLAAEGCRTLILSTDAAHSLSDSFNVQIRNQTTEICENLWGLEVDSLYETEKYWGSVQTWFSNMMSWAQLKDLSTEEIITFPGLEELFSLMEIKQQAESNKYDTLIVDCAPTGETLRLLSYPDLLNWWLEKIFPRERRLLKVVRPVTKMITGGFELPDDQVMNSIGAFVEELKDLRKIISDPNVTSVRIVVNPEKMVIAESRRSFTYLNLSGFNTDAIIINRMIPDNAGDGYWSTWRDIQMKYKQEIHESFRPLPILEIPMMESEVCGIPMLKRIGQIAFGNHEAAAILYQGRIQEVYKEGKNYILELTVPFVSKEQLELSQKGDELTIQAGPNKHKLILPRTLVGRPVSKARFVNQKLKITFGSQMPASQQEEN
jgi:arsenite-activated ATPase ArsA